MTPPRQSKQPHPDHSASWRLVGESKNVLSFEERAVSSFRATSLSTARRTRMGARLTLTERFQGQTGQGVRKREMEPFPVSGVVEQEDPLPRLFASPIETLASRREGCHRKATGCRLRAPHDGQRENTYMQTSSALDESRWGRKQLKSAHVGYGCMG